MFLIDWNAYQPQPSYNAGTYTNTVPTSYPPPSRQAPPPPSRQTSYPPPTRQAPSPPTVGGGVTQPPVHTRSRSNSSGSSLSNPSSGRHSSGHIKLSSGGSSSISTLSKLSNGSQHSHHSSGHVQLSSHPSRSSGGSKNPSNASNGSNNSKTIYYSAQTSFPKERYNFNGITA